MISFQVFIYLFLNYGSEYKNLQDTPSAKSVGADLDTMKWMMVIPKSPYKKGLLAFMFFLVCSESCSIGKYMLCSS